MSTLSADLKKKADQVRRACDTYRQTLHDRMVCMGLAPEGTDRMKTALATQTIVGLVSAAEPANVVGLLAKADIATSEAAMGECVEKAAELEGNLGTAGWEIFEAIGKLDDERKATADAILADVRQALAADEHVTTLAPALKGAHARAVRLLTKAPPPSPPPPPPPPPPGPEVVDQGETRDLTLPAAQEMLGKLGRRVKEGQSVRINVGWVIKKGGGS